MHVIQRCIYCPGQSHPTLGPTLCDNPLEDCSKFHPEDSPHQFDMTIGAIRTSHRVMCPNCGSITPWTALDKSVPVYCVLCGFAMLIRRIKL